MADPKSRVSPNITILATAACIIASFIGVGFFSEYLTKRTFTSDAVKFTGTSALVLFQCSFSSLAAFVLMRLTGETYTKGAIPKKEFVIQSTAYCSAMFFSNKSLQYIDYPTQIITKFLKPITVVLFSIFYSKKYQPRQIVFSAITFVGIALFMYEKFASIDTSKYSEGSFIFGLCLIGVSLLCDGISTAKEDIIAHDYEVPTYHVMLFSNIFSVPLYIVIALVSGDLQHTLSLMARSPQFLAIIVCYIFCSVCGQYFIYKLIELANTILLVCVTNTRKIVTVIISVIVFHHPITPIQIVGIIIVFASLFTDIMTRNTSSKKPLNTTDAGEQTKKKRE